MVESSSDPPQAMKAQHKRLIALWERYGTLVDPGKGRNSITNVLGSDALLPVRTLWREAWKTKSRCRRVKPRSRKGIEWVDINRASELATYTCDIELALVETTRGIAYLGIPEQDDVFGTYCGEVEAVLFPYPEQSDSFASMIRLSQSTIIPAGTHVDDIWKQWFQSIAHKAKDVVVIDRYAITQHNVEGLWRVFDLLCGDSSKCRVTVFASDPSTFDGNCVADAEIEDRSRELLSSETNTLSAIKVILVPDYHMARDRYVRFDECAFTIGHGLLEVLSRERLREDATCVLDTSPNGIMGLMRRETRRLQGRTSRVLQFSADST